ncbi:unannotated protein [freshwater metagenome]|uniref:Unannotated protein n=1 Tax=freshwater metagenome TaxID=449393 RepID=A0A6J6RQD4_9ZZZZ
MLGDPIAHSLSPVLHRAGYAALGLDWTYDAVRIDEAALAGFLDRLDDGWRGLSLTMPLKRTVLPLVDHVSGRALLAGAANTVVRTDGRLSADNTDLPGAVAALRERHDGTVRTAAVLGGGATAASIGLALCDEGAARVTLLARTPERASGAAAAIAAHPSRPQVDVLDLDAALPVDVLVSTVPAAAQTPELVQRWSQVEVVFEALYDPWPTPLAAATLASGRTLVGGLDLLVHQAALQFTLFTAEPAPLDAMRAAGEAELTARTS